MCFSKLVGKVTVVLLSLSASLVLADRDQTARKGRRAAAVVSSALMASGDGDTDTTAKGTDEAPSTERVDKAHGIVDEELNKVKAAITAANEQAKQAMTGAVNWKTESAKIPEIIAQVHTQTKEKIWKELQNVAPIIGGAEKKSMFDLLKGIVEDIAHQKTDKDEDITKNEQAKVDEALKALSSTAAKPEGEAKQEGVTDQKSLFVQVEGESHTDDAKLQNQQSSGEPATKDAVGALMEAAKAKSVPDLHQEVQVDASGAVSAARQQSNEEAVAPFVEVHEVQPAF